VCAAGNIQSIPAENMPEPPPTAMPKGNVQMFMAKVCAGIMKRQNARMMCENLGIAVILL
jgi:hypothetical protein